MNARRGLVVDASVAVKWHLRDEEFVAEASALLEGFFARQVYLTAPAFIRYEVAQSLERARRNRRLSEGAAWLEFQSFLAFGIHLSEDGDATIALAQRIAGQIDVSVYDGLYLAHAEALGFDFVTDDTRLARRAADYPVGIRRLPEVAGLL